MTRKKPSLPGRCYCGPPICAFAAVALLLMLTGPALAITVTTTDPNEAGIPDGYDCEKIIIDDSNSTYLTITYDLYANVLIHDEGQQVQYLFWLDVYGFDQNPSQPDPGGIPYDFQINWFASNVDGFGNDIWGAKTPFSTELRAQNGSLLQTYSGSNPSGGDTVTLQIPWAALVDTSNNEAFPSKTLLPPGFAYYARLDNGQAGADDRVPDSSYVLVPEPLTMAGLMLGIGSVVTYVRKRRTA